MEHAFQRKRPLHRNPPEQHPLPRNAPRISTRAHGARCIVAPLARERPRLRNARRSGTPAIQERPPHHGARCLGTCSPQGRPPDRKTRRMAPVASKCRCIRMPAAQGRPAAMERPLPQGPQSKCNARRWGIAAAQKRPPHWNSHRTGMAAAPGPPLHRHPHRKASPFLRIESRQERPPHRKPRRP
jgi:hypothetical protein